MVAISETQQTELDEVSDEKVSVAAKVFSILFSIFVYLLAAAILIGAILFSFDASPTKSVFGFRYYTVLTGSMAPTYDVGDVIFVKLGETDDINVGDVITFNPSQDGDAYLTHRVTEKIENYKNTGVTCFRTRGDANESEDSFLIDSSRVIGTVQFGIPKLGYVIRFVQLRWYFVVPIAVMIPVFFYLLKRYFLLSDDEDEDEKAEEDNDNNNNNNNNNVSSSDTDDSIETVSAEKDNEESPLVQNDVSDQTTNDNSDSYDPEENDNKVTDSGKETEQVKTKETLNKTTLPRQTQYRA